MSFEHIKKNHVNSKNNRKSQFHTKNDEELKKLIKDTVSYGVKVEKGDNIIYEKKFNYYIGRCGDVDSDKIRVIMRNGYVVTAFPIK